MFQTAIKIAFDGKFNILKHENINETLLMAPVQLDLFILDQKPSK